MKRADTGLRYIRDAIGAPQHLGYPRLSALTRGQLG